MLIELFNHSIYKFIDKPGDICLDDMDQTIETNDRLVVKFGEEYSEDDDLVTVAENEGILDVAWFIYEFYDRITYGRSKKTFTSDKL